MRPPAYVALNPRPRGDDAATGDAEGTMVNDPNMTDLDRALAFAIPARSARGRIVRLGTALDEVLAAHAYPPAIEKLLAEALTLAALIGSTLKDSSGQLTMQTRTDNGVVPAASDTLAMR